MSQVIYRGPSINRVKRLGLMMSTVPPGKSYCNLRVVQDAYNCSGNYGKFYQVFIIDYELSTPHSTASILLNSKIHIF